ncbi:MAG: HEAT repeat domain-containing protein [Armatimonadota bacterium]
MISTRATFPETEPAPLASLEARLQSREVSERAAAAEALGHCGEQAVELLCGALFDSDEEVRLAAALSLARIGAPALAALEVRLDGATAVERECAAWALSHYGPAALPALERAITSWSWRTRVAAAKALPSLGLPEVPPLLCGALRDRDHRVRLAAVEALRSLGLPETAPPLCEALKDRDPRVRLAAVQALGDVGDAAAVGPLQELLRDGLVGRSSRRHLWVSLLFGLGSGPALFLLLLTAFKWDLDYLGGFLVMIGNAVAVSVVNRRRRGEVVSAVMEALVRIGERQSSLELRAALPDLRLMASRWFQQDTAMSLASRKAVRRIEELTKDLKDLPLPADASPGEATLPRVGEAPAADPQTLPRIR